MILKLKLMLFSGGKMMINEDFIKEIIENDNSVLLIGEYLKKLWENVAYKVNDLKEYYTIGEDECRNIIHFLDKSYFEFYKVLAMACLEKKTIFEEYEDHNNCCFIILDGMSFRESALIYNKLIKKGLNVKHSFNFSAIPSETEFFREKIPVKMNDFEIVNKINNIQVPSYSRYVWSQFPDIMLDKIKAGLTVISSLEHMYETTERIVFELLSQIKAKKIIISSDHGYVRSEAGNIFTVNKNARKMFKDNFGSKRYTKISDNFNAADLINSGYIEDFNGYYLTRSLYSWPVKGRTSIYIHGGLSLMECFTPVLLIDRDV